jgi:hypothetical protein
LTPFVEYADTGCGICILELFCESDSSVRPEYVVVDGTGRRPILEALGCCVAKVRSVLS